MDATHSGEFITPTSAQKTVSPTLVSPPRTPSVRAASIRFSGLMFVLKAGASFARPLSNSRPRCFGGCARHRGVRDYSRKRPGVRVESMESGDRAREGRTRRPGSARCLGGNNGELFWDWFEASCAFGFD